MCCLLMTSSCLCQWATKMQAWRYSPIQSPAPVYTQSSPKVLWSSTQQYIKSSCGNPSRQGYCMHKCLSCTRVMVRISLFSFLPFILDQGPANFFCKGPDSTLSFAAPMRSLWHVLLISFYIFKQPFKI